MEEWNGLEGGRRDGGMDERREAFLLGRNLAKSFGFCMLSDTFFNVFHRVINKLPPEASPSCVKTSKKY